MNKLLAISLAALSIGLYACNNDEQTHDSGDSQVTVNRENGVSSIESSDGKDRVKAIFQEGGALPENFPKDIPIASGAVLQASIEMPEGYNLRFTTTASMLELSDFYRTQLKANDWTISAVTSMEDLTIIIAEKDERDCQINISQADHQTMLMINVINEEAHIPEQEEDAEE